MSEQGLYVCHLFDRDRPHDLIEARNLARSTSIGRDEAADWVLADANGMLSRIHCVLTIEDGLLTLLDQSKNGTFLDGGARAPRGRQTVLKSGQRINLGNFSIQIEQTVDKASAGIVDAALEPAPVEQALNDWSHGLPAPVSREASLLEAFCEGAKLDASALSAEDPAELMRRIGAIYSQTILGLSILMSERAKIKTDHQLDRTTIGATANNPFKWAPTRTLAQELLLSRNDGFLSEAHAVRASFEDLSQHMAGTIDGAKATLALLMQAFSPADIEAEAKVRGAILRSRPAVCWDIFVARYAEFADSADDVPLNRAFAERYDRSADERKPKDRELETS